jgi:hypothetical protein
LIHFYKRLFCTEDVHVLDEINLLCIKKKSMKPTQWFALLVVDGLLLIFSSKLLKGFDSVIQLLILKCWWFVYLWLPIHCTQEFHRISGNLGEYCLISNWIWKVIIYHLTQVAKFNKIKEKFQHLISISIALHIKKILQEICVIIVLNKGSQD